MYKIWGQDMLLNRRSLMGYLEKFGLDKSVVDMLDQKGFINAGGTRIMKIKF
jgi:hypothetical protein